jgi:hypothetical protein
VCKAREGYPTGKKAKINEVKFESKERGSSPCVSDWHVGRCVGARRPTCLKHKDQTATCSTIVCDLVVGKDRVVSLGAMHGVFEWALPDPESLERCPEPLLVLSRQVLQTQSV